METNPPSDLQDLCRRDALDHSPFVQKDEESSDK